MATWTFAVNRSASCIVRTSRRCYGVFPPAEPPNPRDRASVQLRGRAVCQHCTVARSARWPLGRGHPRHLPPSRARAECLFVAGRTSVRVCLAASLALTRRGRRPARTARTPWRRSVACTASHECGGSGPRWPHALGAPCFPVRSARTLLVRGLRGTREGSRCPVAVPAICDRLNVANGTNPVAKAASEVVPIGLLFAVWGGRAEPKFAANLIASAACGQSIIGRIGGCRRT